MPRPKNPDSAPAVTRLYVVKHGHTETLVRAVSRASAVNTMASKHYHAAIATQDDCIRLAGTIPTEAANDESEELQRA